MVPHLRQIHRHHKLTIVKASLEARLRLFISGNAARVPIVTPDVRVETATIEDLSALTDLVVDLLDLQDDFTPDPQLQELGIRHILEEPARGRIFVVRSQDRILGMANLLFTVSTAMGGFVLILEDVIIHPDHRGLGLGARLVEAVIAFAREKNFKRITLLADKLSNDSQAFFKQHGFQFSTLIPMRLILDYEKD